MDASALRQARCGSSRRLLRRRWLPLLIGCFCGLLIGAANDYWVVTRVAAARQVSVTATPGAPGGPLLRIEPVPALALLESLEVRAKPSRPGYARSVFGAAWADADRNGCDTRNDVLRRDLAQPSFAAGSTCVIATGRLQDPYTGQEISFRRGAGSSAQVQIDHVVALADAWRSGAAELDVQRRLALANDPLNLLAVEGAANQRKGAADASTWLPQERFRCHYVSRQISVKAAYGLWVDPGEREAMLAVLLRCPETLSMPSGL